ncbi:MAG: RNA polymerase sigma-70 factor [Massilibacteroides sp.]|nr:RNA polymerase sigma-70 factor [Massilibacteroides sp.]
MYITSTTEDKELLSFMKKGSAKAFDFLFDRYYTVLCAYSQRFLSLEEAEEIVQDIMMWLWSTRKEIIIETSLKSYLFKTVYNRSINKKTRDNYKKNKLDLSNNVLNYRFIEDTDLTELKDLRIHMEKAIEALPETYREAFKLHFFEQMTYKEIANQINVSSKTVDYRIQQATKSLRKSLDYLLFIKAVFFV